MERWFSICGHRFSAAHIQLKSLQQLRGRRFVFEMWFLPQRLTHFSHVLNRVKDGKVLLKRVVLAVASH
eukprot:4862217-Pyramimonas_sp.AAC.1